jgi:hypothetical protein
MSETKIAELYNGWKNKQTWNVALWIENDEGLYFSACEYKERCESRGVKPTYRGFIAWAGLFGNKTPDGYKYDSQKIDYKALSDMIRGF